MKNRSKVRTGLAAVAALCTVVLATAAFPGRASAAPGDSGSPRPYRTQGSRIDGTQGPEGAPTIERRRTYVDAIEQGQTRYYSVELDDASTAYASAVAAPQPGSQVASHRDGIKVALRTTDGTECGAADPRIGAKGMASPLADYASRQITGGAAARCQAAGRYLVTVERIGDTTGTPEKGSWPLELRLMLEPKAKSGGTERPSPGSWSTRPPTLPKGPGPLRVGGTGFNDAKALSTGAWRDQIRPGETRFYKVAADWGQQVFAAAELPDAAGGKGGGPLDHALGVRVYNSARGLVRDSGFAAYAGKKTSAEAGTAPVAYGNRYEKTDASVRATSFVGWYYVAVTLHPDAGRYFSGSAPLTLRLEVKGEPESGPEYDGNAPAAGFGLPAGSDSAGSVGGGTGGPGPGRQRPPSTADGEGGDDGGMRAVAYAGFGTGTLLLLVLGVWTAVARRRAGTG